MADQRMSNAHATAYLSSMLNKSLRIHVTDGRMFVGQMKCTDQVMSIICDCFQQPVLTMRL